LNKCKNEKFLSVYFDLFKFIQKKYEREKEDALIALEFQRQFIKEQTNELIIQQKLDKVNDCLWPSKKFRMFI
jgi:hypothetical protein